MEISSACKIHHVGSEPTVSTPPPPHNHTKSQSIAHCLPVCVGIHAGLPIDHSHTTLKYQALHAAVEFAHLDSARLLVAMGAKVLLSLRTIKAINTCKGAHNLCACRDTSSYDNIDRNFKRKGPRE